MESLYFLVPCALIFIGLAIKVLFWAINNGQYDNLDTEAHRILFDAGQSKKTESANKADLAHQNKNSSPDDAELQAPDSKNP